MKKIIFISVVSLILLIFVLGCTPEPRACTMEAKVCPDGSAVGRVLPNCEFAECPGVALVESPTEENSNGVVSSSSTEEPQAEPEEAAIFCPDSDGNKDACLLHPECKWSGFRKECYSLDGSGEDKEVEEEEESEFASDLEKYLPDTIQNQICKKLPLTKELSPGDRHYCFAVVNNNAEFCEFIVGDNEEDLDAQNEKNLCLAHAKKDISYCKNMNGALGKRTCYFGLSVISGNIDICGGITYDTNLKQLCYYSFVNALYWEDKSDKITQAHCNKLPEPDRSTCLAYKDRDVSLCKSNVNCLTCFEQPMSFCTTGKGKSLEYCIRDRAMSSKDFSICETLTGKKREDCIGDFAGHITQDISTCDKITSDFARHSCYKDVAVQSGTNFWFNLYN